MPKTSEPSRLKGPIAWERRRRSRVAIAFPIEVSGMGVTGTAFHDRTLTTDVSESGCQFPFERKLCIGEHLSLRLVNTDFAKLTGTKTQLFEVVWVEPNNMAWVIGARKLQAGNIWPLTFPLRSKPLR
jgi:PilZ domain